MQQYVIDSNEAMTLRKFTDLFQKVFNLPKPPHDLNAVPGADATINDLSFFLESLMRMIENRDVREAVLTIVDDKNLLKDSTEYTASEFFEYLDSVVSTYGEDVFSYKKVDSAELASEIASRIVKKSKDSVQNISQFQLGVPFKDLAPKTKNQIQSVVEETCRKRHIKLDYSDYDDMPVVQPKWQLLFTAKPVLF